MEKENLNISYANQIYEVSLKQCGKFESARVLFFTRNYKNFKNG